MVLLELSVLKNQFFFFLFPIYYWPLNVSNAVAKKYEANEMKKAKTYKTQIEVFIRYKIVSINVIKL